MSLPAQLGTVNQIGTFTNALPFANIHKLIGSVLHSIRSLIPSRSLTLAPSRKFLNTAGRIST